MIQKIIRWPHLLLKTSCNIVVKQPIADLIRDLKDTLAESGGAGLSANQIGTSLGVLVINSHNQGVKVFVNPQVTEFSDWTMMAEGCLSVPGVIEEVRRAKKIVVKYTSDTGVTREEEFEGDDAHALQHEVDHLNGIVFIDYLKPGKRDQIRAALRKMPR